MGISIFPNPVEDFVRIDFEDEFYKEFKIRVLGIDGREILDFEDKINLDVSNLENGIYILEVGTENEVLVEKFLKI